MQEPLQEELDKVALEDELEKNRDKEEAACCCKKHLRICVPLADKEDTDETIEMKTIVEKLEKLLVLDLSVHNTELGELLVWIGDSEKRYKKIYQLIFYLTLPENQKTTLLEYVTCAHVTKISVHCGHKLPKPYQNCKCNFSEPNYAQKLIFDHIETFVDPLKESTDII